MATVYSLVCWGGSAGKATTSINASTNVITMTNHGLRTGLAIRPTAANNGLSTSTNYYVRAIDSSTFTLHLSGADATNNANIVDLTGTTATTFKSKYYLDISDATRWGNATPASARIYDGWVSWRAARTPAGSNPAGAFDSEVLELGELMDDRTTSQLSLDLLCASILITPTVNGVFTTAYHNGMYGGGYTMNCLASFADSVRCTTYRHTIEGITLRSNVSSTRIVRLDGLFNTVRNCFVIGSGSAASQDGVQCNGAANNVINNIIHNCWKGVNPGASGPSQGSLYANNTVIGDGVAGGTGFIANASVAGFYYNNISVNNATNWGTNPSTLDGAGYNGGVSGNTPWYKGTDTGIKTLTANDSTFVNFAGNSFALSASSTAVNSGTSVLGRSSDMVGDLVPNYESATYPNNIPDLGAFEYDHGEGQPPNFQDFIVYGITANHRLAIYNGATELYNGVPGQTSYTLSVNCGTAGVTLTIYARCGSTAPYYYPVDNVSVSVSVDGGSVTLQPIPDIARGATKAVGWSVNDSTGAITHDSGTTVYTVQELYSYLADYYTGATKIKTTRYMTGTTPDIFDLIGTGSISDADMQWLNGGSLSVGSTLWANVYTVGGKVSGTSIYMHVDGVLQTAYWGTGDANNDIDVMIELPNYDGTEVFDIRAHNYGDTYDHWQMTVNEGRNVAAISTLDDANNTTARTTVDDYNIAIATTTGNPKSVPLESGSGDYTLTINANGLTGKQVYEWLKYKTDEDNTALIPATTGVAGNVYVSANGTWAEIKTSPLGTYSRGVLSLAQGIFLDGIASADALNYVLTDNDGVTHQEPAPLGYQSVTISGAVAGTRIQIFDLTSDTELYNGTPTFPYRWDDTNPYAADREIRLRAAYVTASTAKVFIEQTIGTCTSTTPAVTYLVSQADDAVYISNAIDGITELAKGEITFTDASTDLININVAGGTISLKAVYAAFCAWIFGATGITDDIAYIDAIDGANYVLTSMKFKNTSSPSVPTTLTGGYFVDATSGQPITCIDTTGGMLFTAVPHVVEKIITVTGGDVVTGTAAEIIAAIPSAGTIASQVLTSAQSAPIYANIKQVANATVNGTGTDNDPWGP